jgi:hypothetical protein
MFQLVPGLLVLGPPDSRCDTPRDRDIPTEFRELREKVDCHPPSVDVPEAVVECG